MCSAVSGQCFKIYPWISYQLAATRGHVIMSLYYYKFVTVRQEEKIPQLLAQHSFLSRHWLVRLVFLVGYGHDLDSPL